MSKKLFLITIVILVLILFNVFFIFRTANHENITHTSAEEIATTDTQAFLLPVFEVSYFPILDTNIASPVIKAKAAVVYDVNSGRNLYAKNISQKLPIASLTKILTSIVANEKLNFKDIVTVSKEAIKVDGARQDLYLGERLTVKDLVKMMLIKSSNDAAYALASYAKTNNIDLIDEMNKVANGLGMLSSHFKDVAGLNDEAYSNSEDMIKLVRRLLEYPALVAIMSEKEVDIKSIDGIVHHVETTNQLLGEVPGILAGKTGYTDDAMGCMVLVVQTSDGNDRIINIVLGSSERFNDTKNLIDWINKAYRWH